MIQPIGVKLMHKFIAINIDDLPEDLQAHPILLGAPAGIDGRVLCTIAENDVSLFTEHGCERLTHEQALALTVKDTE